MNADLHLAEVVGALVDRHHVVVLQTRRRSGLFEAALAAVGHGG
jgi:hypothetical protein